MEENSKQPVKMNINLHPDLEEASGMAPKMRMFEELKKMEHERRTRVEMERVQQEEQAKQDLERKHLEREQLEEKEEDVDLPKTSQNTQSQPKRAWLNQDIADVEHFTADRVKTLGSTAITSPCFKKYLVYRITEPDKKEQAEQQGLLRKDDAGKTFLEPLTQLTHHTGEAEEDGDALQDQKPFNKKVTFNEKVMIQTYQREAEEGSEPYLPLARGMPYRHDSPLLYTHADRNRATLMATEKQRQKIEAKLAAGQKGLSTVQEDPSEVVEKCLEQLSHTGEAEKDGDALQDEEEDVEEVYLMFGQNLLETNQNTLCESLLSVVEISKKDLNFKQKAFNWLNKRVKKRTLQKIERTYQREAEEGSEPYLPLVRCMASMRDSPLSTHADRERAKREKLMLFEEQRQKFEDRWNQNQAQRAARKEAQRLKEEERYERWSVKRSEWLNQNIGDDEHFMEDRVETSGSTTAKKQMSIWQKRFIRINCLIG